MSSSARLDYLTAQVVIGMDKWLDPYLGPGATDVIWCSPRSERQAVLCNRLSSGTAEQCGHNVRRESCETCNAPTVSGSES